MSSKSPSNDFNFFKLYFNSDNLLKQSVIKQALNSPDFMPTLEKMAKAASGIVDAIWNNDNSEIPAELFNTYNDNFHKGIGDASNLLKNNVSRLAAAKTNYTVQQLHNAKTAAKGNKDEYNRQAKLILARANSTQAAEYNTAVHRARSCKQWEQFQGERHLYPNIQWLRTRSATPREIHLAYVGRIWPMDDPFWNSNSPGCTWNCKCSWKTTDQKPTDNSSLSVVEASAGLEGNPYYTHEIFTNKHPYFSRVDKHVPNLGPLHNPDDIAFIQKITKDGHKYLEHFNCKDEKEIAENRKVVELLLKEGVVKEAALLPRIHQREVELRERYYGKEYNSLRPAKCPDCKADGEFLEFKETTLKNLSANILKASKQGDIAVIKLDSHIDNDWITRFCKKQFTLKDRKGLKKIIISTSEKTYLYRK